MNFIFVSPQFPRTYWNFCDRLKRNGANVLGIGDAPYEALPPETRNALTEYYRVNDMENYDEVFRAVAFFSFKYGKIDWIESNNEHWLEQDARLRTDFNVRTGVGADEIRAYKSKSAMKAFYAAGGVPTARFRRATTFEDARAFAREVGFPLIVKPDVGVGAANTWSLHGEDELRGFFENLPREPYVMEEFVRGDICSFDAITDGNCNILFESMTVWPPSIMDIVNFDLDLAYYVSKDIPETLRTLGRKTVAAFGARRRFVHLEFFRLTEAREGLGGVGDFVALEVNMRPAGGYTPDMMNFAHGTDVYQIWADMVVYGERRVPAGTQDCCCVYASRKDGETYAHAHEEILARYGNRIVMCERMPELMVRTMGNQMYTAKLDTEDDVRAFIRFVHE